MNDTQTTEQQGSTDTRHIGAAGKEEEVDR
jgi:hypothetical protein